MAFKYNEWKSFEKIFWTEMAVIILCSYLFYGGIQQLDYCSFKLNEKDYEIIEAKVLYSNEYPITLRRYGEALFVITQVQIYYVVDGRHYGKLLYTYADEKESETIKIAVNKNNPKKVKRCAPYSAWRDNFWSITLRMAVIIGIFEGVFLFRRLIRTKDKRKALQKVEEKQKEQEKQRRLETVEKQTQIKAFCSNPHEKSALAAQLENRINELDMTCSGDFAWCLAYLTGQEQFYSILLLEQDDTGDFRFIQETLRLREKGLPQGYYVIAKYAGYYLCGKADSPRVFSFSLSLGITNTQYATIYDYILDNLH